MSRELDCAHDNQEQRDCVQCHKAAAHRTAIDLVLANLEACKPFVDQGMTAERLLRTLKKDLETFRDWTPEHAAEVLTEAKEKP